MGGKFFETLHPADLCYPRLWFKFVWLQNSRLNFIFLQNIEDTASLPSKLLVLLRVWGPRPFWFLVYVLLFSLWKLRIFSLFGVLKFYDDCALGGRISPKLWNSTRKLMFFSSRKCSWITSLIVSFPLCCHFSPSVTPIIWTSKTNP